MKTALSIFLLLALQSLVMGSPKKACLKNSIGPQKLKYAYVVETDLSTEKFSEVFCDRLSNKHNWNKVSTTISCDETYTSLFSFTDNASHRWKCEVKIKKIINEANKMSVEMTMDPYLES